MTAALEGGEWSAARPGRTLPPGKDPVPIFSTDKAVAITERNAATAKHISMDGVSLQSLTALYQISPFFSARPYISAVQIS